MDIRDGKNLSSNEQSYANADPQEVDDVLPVCDTDTIGETSASTPPILEDTGGHVHSLDELQYLINNYVHLWGDRLGLMGWTININCFDKLTYNEDQAFDPEYPVVMRNITRWMSKLTTLEVDVSICRKRTEEELSEDILHELLHVVVNEMRWDTNRAPDRGHGCACEHDHEERIVTQLTNTIWTLYCDIVLAQ